MAKKSKKKKSFVLSDEELDQVSGGAGPAAPPVKQIARIAVAKGIAGGGIAAEPVGVGGERNAPIRVNRGSTPGFGGGQQM